MNVIQERDFRPEATAVFYIKCTKVCLIHFDYAAETRRTSQQRFIARERIGDATPIGVQEGSTASGHPIQSHSRSFGRRSRKTRKTPTNRGHDPDLKTFPTYDTLNMNLEQAAPMECAHFFDDQDYADQTIPSRGPTPGRQTEGPATDHPRSADT